MAAATAVMVVAIVVSLIRMTMMITVVLQGLLLVFFLIIQGNMLLLDQDNVLLFTILKRDNGLRVTQLVEVAIHDTTGLCSRDKLHPGPLHLFGGL